MMDQQFFRKMKESTIMYAAQASLESGLFTVIQKNRLNGQRKIIAEDLKELEACKLRNDLIAASDGNGFLPENLI